MKWIITIFISILFFTESWAQSPYLKPSIGLAALPADTESICNIPLYLGNYDTSGYLVGDTIPNFILYTAAGTPVNIHNVLHLKKPVLLVAGSYTCSEFRDRVQDINDMAAFYQGLLNIYVIYTLEAHPDNAICAYTGNLYIGPANYQANILYPQEETYGERRLMVDTMDMNLAVHPTILVDGPCNEWWSNFGPAPDNGYLIDTNGIVFAKNPWFNHEPYNMWCSIDSLLGTNSGHCIAPVPGATFDFQLQQDSVVNGVAGDVLTVQGMLKNLSPTTSVTINIGKTANNTPAGWETALCTDICLPPNVNTTQLSIAPADSQSFIFYFYTDSIPASGSMEVTFRNPLDTTNQLSQRYYANTSPLLNMQPGIDKYPVSIYPNPATNKLHLRFPYSNEVIASLTDLNNKSIKQVYCNYCNTAEISIPDIPKGFYILKVIGGDWNKTMKIMIQ